MKVTIDKSRSERTGIEVADVSVVFDDFRRVLMLYSMLFPNRPTALRTHASSRTFSVRFTTAEEASFTPHPQNGSSHSVSTGTAFSPWNYRVRKPTSKASRKYVCSPFFQRKTSKKHFIST